MSNSFARVLDDLAGLETALRSSTHVAALADKCHAISSRVAALQPATIRPLRSGQEWKVELLRQAKDDLAGAIACRAAGGLTTVECMLLQMAFEKIAKAAIAITPGASFSTTLRSHRAAGKWLPSLRQRFAGSRTVKYPWKAIIPRIRELEESHPAVATAGPHLEYPWEAGTCVLGPDSAPIVRWFRAASNQAHVAAIYKLASQAIRDFSRWFG